MDSSRPVTGYPVPPSQPGCNPNGYPPPQHGHSTAAGAAYPYHAPPPSSQNGYYNMYPNHLSSAAPPRRPTFFSRFVVAMIAFFVIVGTALFIAWLVLRPRVPEFRVDSVTVAAFNLSSPGGGGSSPRVSGDWDVALTVANPNKKMSVYYHDVASTLYYDGSFLALTTSPPFDQGTRDRTPLTASFAAVSLYIEPPVAKKLGDDRSRGSVSFDLKVTATAWFKTGAWRTRRRWLRVLCRDLVVNFPANGRAGKMAGGPRDCRVGL